MSLYDKLPELAAVMPRKEWERLVREGVKGANMTPAMRDKLRRQFIRSQLRAMGMVVPRKGLSELDRVLVVHVDREADCDVRLRFEGKDVGIQVDGKDVEPSRTFRDAIRKVARLIYESALAKAWESALAEWNNTRAFSAPSEFQKTFAGLLRRPSDKAQLMERFAPGGELVSVKIHGTKRNAQLELLLEPTALGKHEGKDFWTQLSNHVGDSTYGTLQAILAAAHEDLSEESGRITFDYSATRIARLLNYSYTKNGSSKRIAGDVRNRIDRDLETLYRTRVTAEFKVRGKAYAIHDAPLFHFEGYRVGSDMKHGEPFKPRGVGSDMKGDEQFKQNDIGRKYVAVFSFGLAFEKLWKAGAMQSPVPYSLLGTRNWGAFKVYGWLAWSGRVNQKRMKRSGAKQHKNRIDTLAKELAPELSAARGREAIRSALEFLKSGGWVNLKLDDASPKAMVHFVPPSWPWFAKPSAPQLTEGAD